MGRPPRVQFSGACYFITLQGNNRQDIFMSNQDRRQFLSCLRSCQSRYGLKIYAYCLLPNRAVLLLETSQPNLSLVMQLFCTSYTKHFNSAHDTAGHVFQGRYKALLVDKENLLAEMTRYVHLEPVRAGLRESPWRYPWSSCADYVQIMRRESYADADDVLYKFGRNRLTASVRYLKWLKERMKAASDMVLPVTGGQVVGNAAFLARISSQRESGGGAQRLSALDQARSILAEVGSSHGMDEDRLTGRIQWREVAAVRRQAIYRIWKEAKLGVSEIGRMFNRTPSAISQIVKAMESGNI